MAQAHHSDQLAAEFIRESLRTPSAKAWLAEVGKEADGKCPYCKGVVHLSWPRFATVGGKSRQGKTQSGAGRRRISPNYASWGPSLMGSTLIVTIDLNGEAIETDVQE
jgi:hypothetical protein